MNMKRFFILAITTLAFTGCTKAQPFDQIGGTEHRQKSVLIAKERVDLSLACGIAVQRMPDAGSIPVGQERGITKLKQCKIWFDEECLGFLDQRKQAEMQWIEEPSQSNVDNLNNVRREATRHFRNKKKAYLKAKMEDLETNSKIKNIKGMFRAINDFKKGYETRINTVKDEKGDLVADSYSILAR